MSMILEKEYNENFDPILVKELKKILSQFNQNGGVFVSVEFKNKKFSEFVDVMSISENNGNMQINIKIDE